MIEERERKQERARESNLQKEETRWQAAMQQHHMVCCYMCDVTFSHIYSYTHTVINQYVHVYIYIQIHLYRCIHVYKYMYVYIYDSSVQVVYLNEYIYVMYV